MLIVGRLYPNFPQGAPGPCLCLDSGCPTGYGARGGVRSAWLKSEMFRCGMTNG